MEREAKILLFQRLDENLREHTKSMFQNNSHPDMKDIYELQSLAELHYRLKAEHTFTPAEVEALLQFKDSLNVARWCWEENTHTYSFPICDILKEINADARFEKVELELSPEDKVQTLVIRLGKNLFDFQEKLQTWSNQDLIDHCEEIAATMAAYQYMSEEFAVNPADGVADYLLQYDNPLAVLRDHWPECTLFGVDVIADIQDEIKEKQSQHEQPKSVHERLKNASRTVSEQAKPEKPPRGDGAR